jgi:hypothetical protein
VLSTGSISDGGRLDRLLGQRHPTAEDRHVGNVTSATSSPQIPARADRTDPTGDVGASPPSPGDGGTVLARVQALRPAARAPAAARTRAVRGASREPWATAEGRSAGGSSSGQVSLADREGDVEPSEVMKASSPRGWRPPIVEANLGLQSQAADDRDHAARYRTVASGLPAADRCGHEAECGRS